MVVVWSSNMGRWHQDWYRWSKSIAFSMLRTLVLVLDMLDWLDYLDRGHDKNQRPEVPNRIFGHPAYLTAQMMWMDVVDKFHGPEIPDHCPCCHPGPGSSNATWTSGWSFRAFRGRFLPHRWCWCLSWCRTIWINWIFWLLGDDWYTSYVYIGYIRSSWMFHMRWVYWAWFLWFVLFQDPAQDLFGKMHCLDIKTLGLRYMIQGGDHVAVRLTHWVSVTCVTYLSTMTCGQAAAATSLRCVGEPLGDAAGLMGLWAAGF